MASSASQRWFSRNCRRTSIPQGIRRCSHESGLKTTTFQVIFFLEIHVSGGTLVLLAISHQNGSTSQYCSPFRTTTHPTTRRKWINELALLAISHPKRKNWINKFVLLAISHKKWIKELVLLAI